MTDDVLPVELTAIERRRTTDVVYDALRASILTNRYRPAQRLPVEEIARQLGVSLTPVRHAIQQLATEGLIEIRPRSGTFVASLDIRDIAETFDIRRALECLAGETAIGKITGEQLRQMKCLLGELSRPVVSEEDRSRHEADNSELHRLLVEASGNQRLAEMYEGLKAHLQIARIHRTGREPESWAERLRIEHAEHEQIIAALEGRDREQLLNTIRKHIDRAKADLTESLQEAPDA